MRLVQLACVSIALSGVAFLAGWAGMATLTWSTFGRHCTEGDRAVERFMPEYDVDERHETIVYAPADLVFNVASAFDLRESRLIDAIFRARSLSYARRTAMPIFPRDYSSRRSVWGGEYFTRNRTA